MNCIQPSHLILVLLVAVTMLRSGRKLCNSALLRPTALTSPCQELWTSHIFHASTVPVWQFTIHKQLSNLPHTAYFSSALDVNVVAANPISEDVQETRPHPVPVWHRHHKVLPNLQR